MERTQIINELRRIEITDNLYNNIPAERGERYYIDTLERLHNGFFDDLRLFIANNSKDTVSLYITQTLTDLEEAQQQLNIKYSLYLKDNENIDTTYVHSMNLIQQDYLNRMRDRLSQTLSILLGNLPQQNCTQEYQQPSITEIYNELLVNYEDLLTINDLVSIFKTTRQTIHRWESEGRIQRSNTNGHPRYLKSSIKRLLIEHFPELIQQYKKDDSR